jgi:hypothetical protein
MGFDGSSVDVVIDGVSIDMTEAVPFILLKCAVWVLVTNFRLVDALFAQLTIEGVFITATLTPQLILGIPAVGIAITDLHGVMNLQILLTCAALLI